MRNQVAVARQDHVFRIRLGVNNSIRQVILHGNRNAKRTHMMARRTNREMTPRRQRNAIPNINQTR